MSKLLYAGVSVLSVLLVAGIGFATSNVISDTDKMAKLSIEQTGFMIKSVVNQTEPITSISVNGGDSHKETSTPTGVNKDIIKDKSDTDKSDTDKTKDKDESDTNEIHTNADSLLYSIKSGDTLCSISTKLGYSVDQIAEYNHIQNINLIYAGSVLRVPDE